MESKTNLLYYNEGGNGNEISYAFLVQNNGLWSRREYVDQGKKNPPLLKIKNLGTMVGSNDLEGFEPVFDTRYVLKEIKSVLDEKINAISRKPFSKKRDYSKLLNWVDEAERVLLGRSR